ncbi:MAG: tRNA pseudouridine(38-40) synthase TruA [Oscillospiraceae bacterium]|nr:tRNA pseudouridine(38-40) synthase TruA [Oscillospiraceae bacterium]
MRNFKLVLLYDGTRYHGWERKQGLDTIQGRLENVLSKLCDAPIEVIGAGRTDAGVHAKGMVASAQMETNLSEMELLRAINAHLPADIALREIKEASPRFHARYRAVGKTYCYTCYDGVLKPVFDRKFVTVLDASPDLEAMRQAAAYLVGQHDFKSFCGNPKMKKSTVRTVDRIDIVRKGSRLTFTVHGDGFLQHMVRILVGTLLEVGWGKRSPESMKALLEARSRREAGFTAPAQGLCLMNVDY